MRASHPPIGGAAPDQDVSATPNRSLFVAADTLERQAGGPRGGRFAPGVGPAPSASRRPAPRRARDSAGRGEQFWNGEHDIDWHDMRHGGAGRPVTRRSAFSRLRAASSSLELASRWASTPSDNRHLDRRRPCLQLRTVRPGKLPQAGAGSSRTPIAALAELGRATTPPTGDARLDSAPALVEGDAGSRPNRSAAAGLLVPPAVRGRRIRHRAGPVQKCRRTSRDRLSSGRRVTVRGGQLPMRAGLPIG